MGSSRTAVHTLKWDVVLMERGLMMNDDGRGGLGQGGGGHGVGRDGQWAPGSLLGRGNVLDWRSTNVAAGSGQRKVDVGAFYKARYPLWV